MTKIWGIGPKIDQLLHAKGMDTFDQLAVTDVDTLDQILVDAGSNFRLANRELLSSWLEQAQLAAAGKWDELETFQQNLKSKK